MNHTRPPIKHSTAHVHWVADFIRRERVRQQLTQETLALHSNILPSAMGHYESGANKLSVFHPIDRILAALGYELTIQKKDGSTVREKK